MAETNGNAKHERRPLAAIALSLIMPGLGHIYCGRLAIGLLLTCLSNILVPVFIWSIYTGNSSLGITTLLGLMLIPSIVWVIAIISSYRTARRTRRDYQLKEYNRWYVYVLIILAIMGGNIQSALYIRAKCVEAFIVPAMSMYPTIFSGDRLLANKMVYKTSDPEKGDIVVFPDPDNRWQNFVKRVVAVSGDKVAILGAEIDNSHCFPSSRNCWLCFELLAMKLLGDF